MSAEETAALQETPLATAHRETGARMVPFAGYVMPVQYEGIIAEHQHTRAHAGLFDVSHMGQAALVGPDHETVARALERLVPSDILGLKPGRQRYTVLLNAEGGIVDDLMVARPADHDGTLLLVVNAGRKTEDYAYFDAQLPDGVSLLRDDARALIALQGPEAAQALARLSPGVEHMAFMDYATGTVGKLPVRMTRSGYTGEDGYEISVAAEHAEMLWRMLLDQPEVKPVGLGARDSLRLEAGLCLYGHDIDETTSPVEADLGFVLSKRRREEGGFAGAERILRELAEGPSRRRVGLEIEGRQPAREGVAIAAGDDTVGTVTSGSFAPSVGAPIAMGYVAREALQAPALQLLLRNRAVPARIAALPFVPQRYHRSKPA